MDLVFTTNEKRLNIRVAVLIQHHDEYLVINDNHAQYDYLIGGRVKLFECSLDAAKREVFEELHEQVVIGDLKFTYESFFYEETLKLNYHEIGYVYLGKLMDDSLLLKEKETVMDHNRFLWIGVNQLAHPQFIFDYLRENGMPESCVHLVSNEMSNSLTR